MEKCFLLMPFWKWGHNPFKRKFQVSVKDSEVVVSAASKGSKGGKRIHPVPRSCISSIAQLRLFWRELWRNKVAQKHCMLFHFVNQYYKSCSVLLASLVGCSPKIWIISSMKAFHFPTSPINTTKYNAISKGHKKGHNKGENRIFFISCVMAKATKRP